MFPITTIVSDWADSTTCHGIRDVYRSRSWCGKILWFIITLCFLFYMVTQLIDVYKKFATHQWLTTVQEESSTVSIPLDFCFCGFQVDLHFQQISCECGVVSPAKFFEIAISIRRKNSSFPLPAEGCLKHLVAIRDFPTITICSYNRLQQSERIAKGLTDENLIYIFDKIPVSRVVSCDDYCTSKEGREEFLTWKKTHNMTLKEIFQTMGLSCSKTIQTVRGENFLTGDCISSFNVTFAPVLTMEFGQCHQIATTLTNEIVYAGKTQGLTVLLKANLHEYLNFTVNNYMDEGFAIQFQFGSRIVVGQWLTIAPGFHYMFAMKERKTRIKSPGGIFNLGASLQEYIEVFGSKPKCEPNPTLKYDIDDNYSREQCLIECSLHNSNKYCHCLPFFDSPYVRMCEVEELDECFRLLQENNATGPSESCKRACMEPCNDRTVESSMTFGRFPPRNQLSNIKTLLASIDPSITLEQIREDYVLLDIFYEKLSITVVEWYETLGFDDFISNMGGVMSLWAGMSILTIVQAIVYLLNALLCGLCPVRREKKKSRKVQPEPPAPAPRSQSFPSTSDA